jgi:hypothetical protein
MEKKSLKESLLEAKANRSAVAGKNKMFEGNDKILKAFRTGVLILTIVLEMLLFVGVIIACAYWGEGAVAIAVTFVSMMIFVAISYAAMQLTFSFLVDVKAIRNKLYGIKNDDLLELDSAESDSENGQAQMKSLTGTKSIVEKQNELLSLKKLLDEKVITEEEFETEKKKILS